MESLIDLVKFAWDFFFGKRVKLIAFHTTIDSVELPPLPATVGVVLPGGTNINTHTIVIQNIGRATAHNVRIGHLTLTDVQYRVSGAIHQLLNAPAPATDVEIFVPTLVAGGQIIITYLYYPPQMWNTINTYVNCEEGSAEYRYLLYAYQISRTRKLILAVVFVAVVSALALLAVVYVPQLLDWLKQAAPKF